MNLNIRSNKNRKIYGNNQVISPDGILMFRCDDRKANWYLKKDLGEIVNDKPLTIKLKFKPNGLGNYNRFGLEEMKNNCVICGSGEYLTRHHIFPYCYRKHLPIEMKSHNFHDVLPMCISCHDEYERKADVLKYELSITYDAPIDGEVNIEKHLIKYIKIAKSLNNKEIPKNRMLLLKNELKSFFNIKRLTNNKIESISNIKVSTIKRTHGEIVMSKIKDYQPFIELWRSHFINNNIFNYLPKDWSINNK